MAHDPLFYTGRFHTESSFMSVTSISIKARPLPSPALRRFAWGVLAYFIAVILWGTLVRATGSGDGCGNHWPLCKPTVVQQSPGMQTMIEFTHRLTSGIIQRLANYFHIKIILHQNNLGMATRNSKA